MTNQPINLKIITCGTLSLGVKYTMNSGENSVDLVSDGTLMIDGGTAFGQVPRIEWETQIKPDRRNRIRIGMNSMLIKTPDSNILVDTGAGSKRINTLKETHHINGNKLTRNMKELGLSARDIDIVLLTHLHFDHSGGCTKLTRSGDAIPIYPNARYIIQQDCWESALNPSERYQSTFFHEDFLPLEKSNQLELVKGNKDITHSVKVKMTGGPSKGHQVIFVNLGSEKLVFAGDLIPTPYHLQPECISAVDEFPNDTLVQKKELLDMIMKDGWIIVFSHGQDQRSGYVEEWKGKPHLLPKEI